MREIDTRIEAYAPEVVIVAKGSYPTHPSLLHLIDTAPHLVVCDGAAMTLLQHAAKRRPDLVIGDGDSFIRPMLEQYAISFVHVAEQESNDLTKAVRYVSQQGWRTLAIIGATGLREDHTLANISLLRDYQPLFDDVRMLSDYGTFYAAVGEVAIHLEPKAQLSFFPTLGVPMTAQGVAYPFNDRSFTSSWQATLNQAEASTVHLNSTAPYLIYLAYERK